MSDPTNRLADLLRQVQELKDYVQRSLDTLEGRERAAVARAADAVQLEQFGTAAVHLHEASRVRLAREELTHVKLHLQRIAR